MATINGSSGNDTLTGDAGSDLYNLLARNDKVSSGAGSDTLYGGDGNDKLQGQCGADAMFGGRGTDIFQFACGSGTDSISGGESAGDADTLDFLTPNAMNVTFSGAEQGSYSEAVGGSSGTFSEIEVIRTADGNDMIFAGASTVDQTFYSGAGNDTVFRGSGGGLTSGRGGRR